MLIAHKSDLIRTQLLVKYGGVWADPTTYPLKGLDDWLPSYLESGLFMFQNPGRDRVISNWFIAARPSNVLLEALFNGLCEYWSGNNFRNLGEKSRGRFMQNLEVIINRNTEWPRVWFNRIMTKVLRMAPYLVYHYAFYELVKGSEELGKSFREMPVFESDLPHQLKRLGLLAPVTEEVRKLITDDTIPLFKLDWKIVPNEIPEHTVIAYLLEN